MSKTIETTEAPPVKLTKAGVPYKKRGPKKIKTPAAKKAAPKVPKTEEAKDNLTKNQFKKGQSGNPSGRPKDHECMRKGTSAWRKKCSQYMLEEGFDKINEIMEATIKKQPYAAIDLLKWIASQAYGLPKEMLSDDPEDDKPKPEQSPLIIVDSDNFRKMLSEDAKYD